MMNKLIELKNLTKNFDDQQVLRGINLDIYEKEFLPLNVFYFCCYSIYFFFFVISE